MQPNYSFEMSVDQMRAQAPSVFAQNPQHSRVSDRYAFIPTTRVLDQLAVKNWHPVWVAQSKCHNAEGREYVKHIVRLRNAALANIEGEAIPELVLTNSHNGLSAYKLMAGIFRMVCGNGMIVAEANFASIQIKHVGFTDSEVIEAGDKVIDSVPQLAASIARFRAVTLNLDEQRAFAKAALVLRYPENETPFEPQKLLIARRREDQNESLWHTFNRVQENMMRGGIHYSKPTGELGINLRTGMQAPLMRRNRTRAIQSVNENIKVNRALWTLADEMAKLKS